VTCKSDNPKALIKSKIYDEKSKKDKENQHNNIKLLIDELKLVEVKRVIDRKLWKS
jgi:hypothetical protein